jgi:hypothetical protein
VGKTIALQLLNPWGGICGTRISNSYEKTEFTSCFHSNIQWGLCCSIFCFLCIRNSLFTNNYLSLCWRYLLDQHDYLNFYSGTCSLLKQQFVCRKIYPLGPLSRFRVKGLVFILLINAASMLVITVHHWCVYGAWTTRGQHVSNYTTDAFMGLELLEASILAITPLMRLLLTWILLHF